MWWSWVLTAVGLSGFILAGRKVWWCWYINLACQGLWFAYAIFTEQYGFIVASIAYTIVFAQNAIKWQREHRIKPIEEYNRLYWPDAPNGPTLECCGEHFPATDKAIALHEADGLCKAKAAHLQALAKRNSY